MSQSSRRPRPAKPAPGPANSLSATTWILIAGVVAIAAVLAIAIYNTMQDRAVATASIEGVKLYPGLERGHVEGVVSYQQTPAVGGPHNAVWQNCGIYDQPIVQEHAVHSLEHGAIWITYRPDLPAADVQRLHALAADDYMLLSPYPGLQAPVVASAWNRQMHMTGADDPRLPQFIRRFKNNPSTTPEFGASCLGGVSSPASVDTLTIGGGMVR